MATIRVTLELPMQKAHNRHAMGSMDTLRHIWKAVVLPELEGPAPFDKF